MNQGKIAIIINSYNRCTLLKESIKILADWIPTSEFAERCCIVVFDAGSTDGSIEWLQQVGKAQGVHLELILPTAGMDTSFSAGINAGVSYAEQKFGDLKYLLFYETDNQISNAKPLAEALSILEDRNEVAACGFTVKKHSGAPAGIGTKFPSIFNFLLGKQLVSLLKLESLKLKWTTNSNGVKFSYVDCVYTSPLLVKIDAWKQSGGLDGGLFPFSDCDVDWAKRLQILGWRMGVIEAEGVIHDNRETLSAWSGRRAMQFHRGRLRYLKRFHPILVYLIWPLPLMVRHVIEWTLAQIATRDSIRSKQLTQQFSGLIKRCIYSYE